MTERHDFDQLETDLASALQEGQAVVSAAASPPAAAPDPVDFTATRAGVPPRSQGHATTRTASDPTRDRIDGPAS